MNKMTVIDKPSTDLILVETLKAEVVFVPGGVEKIIAEIAAKVRAVRTDISTKAGRAEISSLAFKVARSKTALDEMGKDLVAEWKRQAGVVDGERRFIRERLDALRDEVRKPLDEFESAEKKRVDAHEAALATIAAFATFAKPEPTAQEIAARIEELPEERDRDWQEFAQRAAEATAIARRTLTEMHAVAERRETEMAEQERLRAEQAARDRQEREDRIAAIAAADARVEAEAKAERECLAAEAKAAEEAQAAADRAAVEQRRVEQERADAVARAEKAEADRKAAADKAEQDRLAAEAKAEADRRAAAEQAERDRAAAIEAERKRVADAKAAEDAATVKREADKKHRAKINGEASASIVGFGIDEITAARLVDAIADGFVPHVTVSY